MSAKPKQQKRLVTIYTSSDFFGSITKREGELKDFGFTKYAQYDRAPFVRYVPKGKRKVAGFVKTSFPYLLIVEGVGHPEPDDMFNMATIDANGTSIKKSRYLSFDDRYKTDFDSKICEYLKTQTVLLDVRHTVGTDFAGEVAPISTEPISNLSKSIL